MSWQRPILNRWLRLTERTSLARAVEPEKLRRAFELKAKLFFHGPRGMEVTEETLGDMDGLRVGGPWVESGNVILYFHGGGYIFGSPNVYKSMLANLSKRTGMDAVLPVYPLSPEHPYPAALNAARAAYDAMLAQGYRPEQIVMGGDSAGGNLVLALLLQLLRDAAPVPAGVFAFSPITDLTFSGASASVNAARDVVLPIERAADMAEMFLAGQAPTDPMISPVFAEFKGAPPVWMCVGDTEILLDDTRRVVQRMQAQDVAVEMHIERDLPHVWPLFHNLLPEAGATLDQLAGWLTQRLNQANDS